MPEMEQGQVTDTAGLRTELEILKNSREFKLGSRLRHSRIFKLIRHARFKNRIVRVKILRRRSQNTRANEVRLVGVWYDEYASGMPLQLLERDLRKWTLQEHPKSPYRQGLFTNQPGSFCIYTQDENLRLEFSMDEKGGQIEIEVLAHKGRKKRIDLYSPVATTLAVFPNRSTIEVIQEKPADEPFDQWRTAGVPSISQTNRLKFTGEELKWIAAQKESPRPLSINHPEWWGILSSASELFGNILSIPDDLDEERAVYYARLIRESACPSITIQGFPRTYYRLVKAVRNVQPELPIFAIYHGNFLHLREDYDWGAFTAIKTLHEEGDIQKVGFVKKGMAEIMATTGMRAAFIMNLVRRVPEGPSQPLEDGSHVGIWGQPDWTWKKSPYAMLASLSLVSGTTAHVFNVSPRAQEFGSQLNLNGEYITESLPHLQTMAKLAQMHVNLYVSLTECAPMLPLESLSVGSPCLIGPTSHYFLDNEYLHRRLVVPYPDNAETIAQYVKCALGERDDIIRMYQKYAPDYNQRAFQCLADFLEYPIGNS